MIEIAVGTPLRLRPAQPCPDTCASRLRSQNSPPLALRRLAWPNRRRSTSRRLATSRSSAGRCSNGTGCLSNMPLPSNLAPPLLSPCAARTGPKHTPLPCSLLPLQGGIVARGPPRPTSLRIGDASRRVVPPGRRGAFAFELAARLLLARHGRRQWPWTMRGPPDFGCMFARAFA